MDLIVGFAILMVSFLAFTPAARADVVPPGWTCDAILSKVQQLDATSYTRWMLTNSAVRPAAQLEAFLAQIHVITVDAPGGPIKDVFDAAENLIAQNERTERLGRLLVGLNLGYQKLNLRCAYLTTDLVVHDRFAMEMVQRSSRILVKLESYLRGDPGYDSGWLLSRLDRVHAEIEKFRVTCLENPPVPKTSAFDRLKRLIRP